MRDTETDNDKRADWGRIGMEAFASMVYGSTADRDLEDPVAFEQCLSDLIADLLHACDRVGAESGLNVWLRCFQRGAAHYTEEKEEEERPAMRPV